MEKHINYEMCKICGGVCCKQNGCLYLPEDFKKIHFNYLRKQIDKGKISISGQPLNGFEGDTWTFVLYLRARNIDAPAVDLITAGGPCVNLTENGCILNETERPTVGLTLNPTKIGGPCQNTTSQEEVLTWLHYNEVLENLVKHYTNQNVTEVLVDQLEQQLEIIRYNIENNQDITPMQSRTIVWHNDIMGNKPYCPPQEAMQLIRLKPKKRKEN